MTALQRITNQLEGKRALLATWHQFPSCSRDPEYIRDLESRITKLSRSLGIAGGHDDSGRLSAK